MWKKYNLIKFLQVKEQSICTLWNLSADEKLRVKIANTDFLPILIKCLDDDDIKVKEAAGGLLANLALSQINHNILVEAGVIPKLVRLSFTLFAECFILIGKLGK